MVTKEGKHIVNARVDVDYSKGKPTVKFGYPYKNKKKSELSQGGFKYGSILIWAIIGIIPVLIFFNFYYNDLSIAYPTECGNLSFDDLAYSKQTIYTGDFENLSSNYSYKAIYGFNITCDNKTHIIDFKKADGFFSSASQSYDEEGWSFFLSPVILMALWMYLSLIPATLINKHLVTRYLIKQKWYQKWTPKANAEGIIFKKRSKKYKKFKAKDVLENVIIIPNFKNVELDYNTTEDFSKYLEKIKIREYWKKGTINTKTKKVKKDKIDEWEWYAIFYFKKKPEKGYLEVTYQ